MKLIRLKITDPKGFRSLQPGFEYYFRKEWQLQEEQANPPAFAPFVCAGPNGSGKSNLLELLAAIFYQLEIRRIRRGFLPEALQDAEQDFWPSAFELDYQIQVPKEYCKVGGPTWAKVEVWKNAGESVRFQWVNQQDFETNVNEVFEGGYADILLPQHILGYSSGENEILSLPFFKMRFVQYDEYWQALKDQLPFAGYPESRLAYLDNSFSQAILLCNLLFEDETTLAPFREEIGIESLKEFRLILKRNIAVTVEVANAFGERHPCLTVDAETDTYSINILSLLEANEALQDEIKREQSSATSSYQNFEPSITRLKRCATCWFEDEITDSLYLDFYVNEATRAVFKNNFSSALSLFQALQVLLTLNLYSVSDKLKGELYQSDSLYVSETVPSLPSDERIMRIKHFWVNKTQLDEPVLLRSLSDGEHQLLHTLGLCLLFKNTNSLFLLDEPETHFNPQWRANFISRLKQSLKPSSQQRQQQEMLITTHTPFLISDSTEDKVLVFKKGVESNTVSVSNPEYKTLGASINQITMATFDKRETIGGYAQSLLNGFKERSKDDWEDKVALIKEINNTLGDSVEKVLLIKSILDDMESAT